MWLPSQLILCSPAPEDTKSQEAYNKRHKLPTALYVLVITLGFDAISHTLSSYKSVCQCVHMGCGIGRM